MPSFAEAAARLRAIPGLEVRDHESLAPYTRFGLGGQARLLCTTTSRRAFIDALSATASMAFPRMVIGGGTNLIVSDEGFEGIVLQFAGSAIEAKGTKLTVEAGANLPDVVDRNIYLVLLGLGTETA